MDFKINMDNKNTVVSVINRTPGMNFGVKHQNAYCNTNRVLNCLRKANTLPVIFNKTCLKEAMFSNIQLLNCMIRWPKRKITLRKLQGHMKNKIIKLTVVPCMTFLMKSIYI